MEEESIAKPLPAARKKRGRTQVSAITEISSKVLKARISDPSSLVRPTKRPCRLKRNTLYGTVVDPLDKILIEGYGKIIKNEDTRRILTLRYTNDVIPRNKASTKIENDADSVHLSKSNFSSHTPLDNFQEVEIDNVEDPVRKQEQEVLQDEVNFDHEELPQNFEEEDNHAFETSRHTKAAVYDNISEKSEVEQEDDLDRPIGAIAKRDENLRSEKLDQKTLELLEVLRKKLKIADKILFQDFAKGFSRHKAATCLFEVLQLKNWSYVGLTQEEPYGPIIITAGVNL